MWPTNKALHVHTILIERVGTVVNQDQATGSNTMLNFFISIGL